MSDIDNQQLFKNNYRRKFLFICAASLAVCSVAPAGFASGDGGDGGEQSDQSGNKPTLEMSQTEFRSLSKKEIGRLSDRLYNEGLNFKLDGFSINMSSRIKSMGLWETRSTRRLLKDMSKLKTKAARKKRLTEEIDRMTKLKKLLEDSMERLKGKTSEGAKMAAHEEWQRWVDVKDYLRHLKVWRRFSDEGTR